MPASEQGASPDRYSLIPRTLIFLTDGDEILLQQGRPGKRLWAGLYNGIGGHVEKGESVLAAARRELAEETGLEQVDLWLCGVITIDTGNHPGIGLFVFRSATAALREIPLKPSAEGALEWLPIASLGDLPLVADLPSLLPKVLAAKISSPPFFAYYSYSESGELRIKFEAQAASQ